MKILNLYAGIGGNRKLWGDEHDITAVELDPAIAAVYQELYPNDTVIVADAHQYLLEHYKEFDFIWSSPPCPTHSRTNLFLNPKGYIRYPDMKLYEEILFLKQFKYEGWWLVENVKPYYTPLVQPTAVIHRHLFWSNFNIEGKDFDGGVLQDHNVTTLKKLHGIELPRGLQDTRKVLRNAVMPEIGLHIFNSLKEQN